MAGNTATNIEGETVQMTVTLPAPLKARIEEAARRNMRSASSEAAFRLQRSFDAEAEG